MPHHRTIRSVVIPALLAGFLSLPPVGLVWSGVPAASPESDAAALAISRTLAEMERAVLAADGKAYLACVDPGEAQFVAEQTYLAKDLARRTPQQIEYTITGPIVLGDGSAQAPMTIHWTLPPVGQANNENAKPVERSIDLTARFVERRVNGVPRWLYAGEVFGRLDAPGVIVYFEPGLDEVATRTLEAFSDIREPVLVDFGLLNEGETVELSAHAISTADSTPLPQRTQTIKLYRTMAALQFSISYAYTDSLSGWNEPGEPIKALANPRASKSTLRPLLAHEFGHVGEAELATSLDALPWWVIEGAADLVAEPFGKPQGKPAPEIDGVDRAVIRWTDRGEIAPWSEMADFYKTPAKFRRNVYTQGHHMMRFITRRWGREKRNAWIGVAGKEAARLTALARSDTGNETPIESRTTLAFDAVSVAKGLDVASREVLGVEDFAAVDAAWRASIQDLIESSKSKRGAEAEGKTGDTKSEDESAQSGKEEINPDPAKP